MPSGRVVLLHYTTLAKNSVLLNAYARHANGNEYRQRIEGQRAPYNDDNNHHRYNFD